MILLFLILIHALVQQPDDHLINLINTKVLFFILVVFPQLFKECCDCADSSSVIALDLISIIVIRKYIKIFNQGYVAVGSLGKEHLLTFTKVEQEKIKGHKRKPRLAPANTFHLIFFFCIFSFLIQIPILHVIPHHLQLHRLDFATTSHKAVKWSWRANKRKQTHVNTFLLSICPDVTQKAKYEGLNPMACGFVLQPIHLVHNH